MADKTGFQNPNSGEGAEDGLFKELMKNLESNGRVEITSLSSEALRKYGTLNLAVKKNGDLIKIRSGGFEISIMTAKNTVSVHRERKIEINGRTVFIVEKEPMHTYVSNCLPKNLKVLLDNLMIEYGYKVDESNWVAVILPRSDVRVRKLQAWIVALIRGFDRQLHDSPLNC